MKLGRREYQENQMKTKKKGEKWYYQSGLYLTGFQMLLNYETSSIKSYTVELKNKKINNSI